MTGAVRAIDPRTGSPGLSYPETTLDQLEGMLVLAEKAARDPRLADTERRMDAMRDGASRLRARASDITVSASSETGLPDSRLGGELERTCVQLEMLADVIGGGDHYEAIVDHTDPDARPTGRPDVRRMRVPLGPVAVFGASNFPLAFSTAGGDTAAALAAGCPVIVKGHPSHPGTGSLVAEELAAATTAAGLPPGTFGHALSARLQIAEALIDDDRISAIAFTGSFEAGTAIYRRAAARPRPVPVFAEMGSLNPVILTAGAVENGGHQIAEQISASAADFGGQLCTKPGIVFVPSGAAGDAFKASLAGLLGTRSPEVLLNERIYRAFRSGIDRLAGVSGVEQLTTDAASGHGYSVRPLLFAAPASALVESSPLREEHFGPAVVIVEYGDQNELGSLLRTLGGQLTATVHAEPWERGELQWLVALCAELAGRLIFDGMPTGVSVCWAMQHGGPFPASSSSEGSVGMMSIRRFTRPVAFQNVPAELLHPALRDENPLALWRRVDGKLGR